LRVIHNGRESGFCLSADECTAKKSERHMQHVDLQKNFTAYFLSKANEAPADARLARLYRHLPTKLSTGTVDERLMLHRTQALV